MQKGMSKIIFFIIFIVLVVSAVIIPDIPLRTADAILIILLTFLFDSWYQKRVQLKLLKREYRRKSQILGDIFKNVPDLIFYKDLNSTYLGCNQAFAKLYNLDESEIIGKTDFEITPLSAKEIVMHDKDVIKTLELSVYEQVIAYGNGIEKDFHIIKSPLFNANNEVYGVLAIARDITEMKEIQNQKETFVATLTHDLNTPTIAQIKALDLLLNGGFGEVEPQQKEILKHVYNSCKYMSNMISTILSTYKYENGQKILLVNNFDFVELINEIRVEINYLAEERGIILETDFSGVSHFINADRMDLKRVVINLLSNAISYSLKNSKVIIRTSLVGDKFRFTVENKSSYVSKEELELLFTKFFTGFSKFRQVGTGLGLYLCKQIISLHKGTMIVESDMCNGNIIGFEINVNNKELRNNSYNNLDQMVMKQ